MNKVLLPQGYRPVLSSYELQKAIAMTKEIFQAEFVETLHLQRVSAPLFVKASSGLNDDLLRKFIADQPDLWQDPDNLPIHSLGCVIGTHIGPGAYGIAFFEK